MLAFHCETLDGSSVAFKRFSIKGKTRLREGIVVLVYEEGTTEDQVEHWTGRESVGVLTTGMTGLVKLVGRGRED